MNWRWSLTVAASLTGALGLAAFQDAASPRRNRPGGGDSPIMIAGGSTTFIARNKWTLTSAPNVSPAIWEATVDPTIIEFERLTPRNGAPASPPASWTTILIHLHGKDNKTAGKEIVTVTRTSETAVSITGTFYGVAAPDDPDVNNPYVRRFKHTKNNPCSINKGELCEHIDSIDLLSDGKKYTYRCQLGVCRIFIGRRS